MAPNQPDTLGTFAREIHQALGEIGADVATLRERIDGIKADRTRCNQDHAHQLEELRRTVGTLKTTVEQHVTEDRVHRAGLDGLSKIMLALATILSAIGAIAAIWK